MKHEAKMRGRLANVFVLIVRLVFGCLFLASSMPKLRQPYDFLGSVYGFELVGPRVGIFVAIMLPWLELLAGICLIGGIFIGGALLAGAAMSAMFTFVLASAVQRGLEISCGCFSPSDASIVGYSDVIRATAMFVAAAAAYICFTISRDGSAVRLAEPG